MSHQKLIKNSDSNQLSVSEHHPKFNDTYIYHTQLHRQPQQHIARSFNVQGTLSRQNQLQTAEGRLGPVSTHQGNAWFSMTYPDSAIPQVALPIPSLNRLGDNRNVITNSLFEYRPGVPKPDFDPEFFNQLPKHQQRAYFEQFKQDGDDSELKHDGNERGDIDQRPSKDVSFPILSSNAQRIYWNASIYELISKSTGRLNVPVTSIG